MNIKEIRENASKRKAGEERPRRPTDLISRDGVFNRNMNAWLGQSKPSDELLRKKTMKESKSTNVISSQEGFFCKVNNPARSESRPLTGIQTSDVGNVPSFSHDDIDLRRNLLSRRMRESAPFSTDPALSHQGTPLSSRASSVTNVRDECSRHSLALPSSCGVKPLDENLGTALLQSNRALVNEVGKLVQFTQDQEEMEKQTEEWHLVAVVVDKFFLGLFLLLLFVSTTTIFMQAPRYVFK